MKIDTTYRPKKIYELVELSKAAEDAKILLQYNKMDMLKFSAAVIYSIPFLIYGILTLHFPIIVCSVAFAVLSGYDGSYRELKTYRKAKEIYEKKYGCIEKNDKKHSILSVLKRRSELKMEYAKNEDEAKQIMIGIKFGIGCYILFFLGTPIIIFSVIPAYDYVGIMFFLGIYAYTAIGCIVYIKDLKISKQTFAELYDQSESNEVI